MTDPERGDGRDPAQSAARIALVVFGLLLFVVTGLVAIILVRNAGTVTHMVESILAPRKPNVTNEPPSLPTSPPPAEATSAADLPDPHGPMVLGNPADWFSPDYYPPDAKRAGQQGRVAVLLDVDETGKVRACTVTESSSVPSLDQATCRLATQFGRYRPATDAKGRPVASSARIPSVRWVLRDE